MRSGGLCGPLPVDLPPWGTICRWFAACRYQGYFERINHALIVLDLEHIGRKTSPRYDYRQPVCQDNRRQQENQGTQAPFTGRS
jgi:hypothetical protein